MSLFGEIKGVTCVNGPEQFLHAANSRSMWQYDKMRWEFCDTNTRSVCGGLPSCC